MTKGIVEEIASDADGRCEVRMEPFVAIDWSYAISSNRYDLVVIGSGPAGQKGAIASAKLGKRVAIINRQAMIGGVCLNTGTIPSKTLREAILYLTGLRQRAFYRRSYRLKQEISISDLVSRVESVKTRRKGSNKPAARLERHIDTERRGAILRMRTVSRSTTTVT